MQTPDWAEFQAEMALLCEAYDRKHTDELDHAYWEALERMSLRDFKRAAKQARLKAGQEGFHRLPMPGRFWELRGIGQPAERPAPPRDETAFDPVGAHANKCLLSWLLNHAGMIDPAQLQRCHVEKNRIAAAYRSIFSEDKSLTGTEVRDALFKAFDAYAEIQDKAA